MISTVVNAIIRKYKRRNFLEFYFQLVSVSFKFFMQRLLHFIVGMNFMLSFSSYKRLLMPKMQDCHKTELRRKFTDSERSILMDLELQILSPSDTVPLHTCFLISPKLHCGNLKDTRKNFVVLDAFIDRIVEKKKASSLCEEWVCCFPVKQVEV